MNSWYEDQFFSYGVLIAYSSVSSPSTIQVHNHLITFKIQLKS